MAYSTVAQLRANLPTHSSGVISDSTVENRIALADKQIDVWALSWGVEDGFDDTPDTPNIINLLSQFCTCELVLLTDYTSIRGGETPFDLAYWQKLKDELKMKLDNGYTVEDSSGVALTSSKISYDYELPDNTYFGYERYGQNASSGTT